MLYKRSRKSGAHWWVRFSMRGIEVRQSSGTDSKGLAQAFEQTLREAIWREQNLGEEIHTWEEACERWLKEKAHKRSLDRDRLGFRTFNDHFEGQAIGDIAASIRGDSGGSAVPALACQGARDRAILRALLYACVKWGWIDRAPKVEMPHAEKHEPRWITKAQFEKLKKELPPHAQALAHFAVSTGLRQRNMFRLRWNNINLLTKSIYIPGADTKSTRAITAPLNSEAREVLKGQRGRHPDFVFTDHKGRAPIGSIKTCWHKATKSAGLEGFRFHDLRHTWAAWHTLAGTPPIILKELGGWSSLAMVERYAHLNPGHLADWADNSRTKAGTRKRTKKRK